MNSEEMEVRRTLDEVKQKVLAFQRQGNKAMARQANLEAVQPLGKLAQLRAHDYDFSSAETYLQAMEQLVNDLGNNANPEEKHVIEGCLFHTIAIVNDAWGTYDLFERMDYVDGAVRLERAEKMYERTADTFSKLKVDDNLAQAVQGQARRAQGLRLFGLGRYDIEAADTIKAEKELEEATEALKRASKLLLNATGLDASSGMHPAYSDSMAAYAQGFLCRARADSSAFVGNYKKASMLLNEQIDAFQQAKEPLLSLTGKVAESMSHRIAQEMDLCEKRQRHFASRPTTQARGPVTLATTLFAGLTVATLFFQLWAATYFGITDRSIIFYVIASAVSILVGGIGAGLAAWSDGTAFFKEIVGATQKKTE